MTHGDEHGKPPAQASSLTYGDVMTTEPLPLLTPTGTCWCGCAKKVGVGSFFAPGHDKVAEAALLAVEYGSAVAQLLHAHGYEDAGTPCSVRARAYGRWWASRRATGHPGRRKSSSRETPAITAVTGHILSAHGPSAVSAAKP